MWPSRAAVFATVALPTGVIAGLLGAPAAMLALANASLLLLVLRLALPTWAHGAFVRGHWSAAARRYRVIAATAWRRSRRQHADLSLSAVALARGDYLRAQQTLDALDGATLDVSARAVWFNNRAYARLRQGTELGRAQELSEAAMQLRPDVPGIRHTHALALLASGRIDASISALDELHQMAELPSALEAERCSDLATAWGQKGEADYAAEYRGRAAVARHEKHR
jgi:hypothetical protein